MHANFFRRVFVVVGSSSSQWLKNQPTLSHPSHSRHLLPYSLSSFTIRRFVPLPSQKLHGFFASTSRNNHLKLKLGNVLESRAGFFRFQLPSKGFCSGGFTGFQKRGWKCWFNGVNGAVFGLIIANAAVFTMWKFLDKKWMLQNFVLSVFSFPTGLHTLITSTIGYVGNSPFPFIFDMIQLYYFGTRIATTLGPLYLLKLYFAGAFGVSFVFLSGHGLVATLESKGVINKVNDKSKPRAIVCARGSVIAISLLDILLYPKVTTYFELMFRVPIMLGVFGSGQDLVRVLEGKKKSISLDSIQAVAGYTVAVIAWRRIRKGRFYY